MAHLRDWTEKLREDVNHEDSILIAAFGKMTDLLFKITILLGLPFLFYVFIKFHSLS
ncbi:hypothetical protein PB1_13309 [Bacillus methanolicus PB1]|uniref:Uncharacterized protein n=1 Tax=Bacillus methanolicus PB1 TaxID=997296 RepID=I3DWB7_BACMT|nr:hypothetical protein [Bacillus methanolicus]EIJ78538.1 hypothetical protein PB1_13309 [Bacillus methanolicus PB1]